MDRTLADLSVEPGSATTVARSAVARDRGLLRARRRLAGRHVTGPVAAGMLLALASAPVARAQGSAGAFGEALEVRVVNVEVVVTDRDGNRATGLGPEDFRLRVAGRSVPIEYFAEIREGRTRTDQVAGSPPPPQTIPPGELVPTSYLVFLDEAFLVGAHRDRILDRLEEQTALLGAADRVALVAFDGRRLEVLAGWMAAGPELSAAFRLARTRPVHGLSRLAESRSFRTGVEIEGAQREEFLSELSAGQRETFGFATAPDAYGERRAYAELLASQLAAIAGAVAGGMRALAEAPGRKVALLLSGGWHFDPAEAAANEGRARAPLPFREVPGGEELFAPIVETANLLGYTLYPIDVPGLVGERDLVERVRAVEASAEDPRESGPPLLSEHASHSTLLHLASRTGGKALLNELRDEALRLTIADTRSYYWLGFTPAWERDDDVSRIEIEVLRPGLQARFRRSLLDLSRESEVTARVESLLYFEAPAQLVLPARVGGVTRIDRQTIEVSFDFAVPVRAVTFLPVRDGWEASLELRLLALDERGGRSETSAVPLRLTSPRAPSPGAHVRHRIEVTLRNAPQEVVLAVYDRASGTLLGSRLRIDPALALEAKAPDGRPPF